MSYRSNTVLINVRPISSWVTRITALAGQSLSAQISVELRKLPWHSYAAGLNQFLLSPQIMTAFSNAHAKWMEEMKRSPYMAVCNRMGEVREPCIARSPIRQYPFGFDNGR